MELTLSLEDTRQSPLSILHAMRSLRGWLVKTTSGCVYEGVVREGWCVEGSLREKDQPWARQHHPMSQESRWNKGKEREMLASVCKHPLFWASTIVAAAITSGPQTAISDFQLHTLVLSRQWLGLQHWTNALCFEALGSLDWAEIGFFGSSACRKPLGTTQPPIM